MTMGALPSLACIYPKVLPHAALELGALPRMDLELREGKLPLLQALEEAIKLKGMQRAWMPPL